MGVQTDGQYQYFTEYNKQYMSPCPDCRNFNSIVVWDDFWVCCLLAANKIQRPIAKLPCWMLYEFYLAISCLHLQASPSDWAAGEAGPGGGEWHNLLGHCVGALLG